MSKTIAFTFAGRRANMELQVPMMRRVLELNPDVDWHIWDLARDREDSRYLRTIEGDRIRVCTQFAGENPWERFDDVYRHYAHDDFRDHLFVKLDDDVVFLEAGRFSNFVAAIAANRGTVLSAKVINNGACTPTEPGLWNRYDRLRPRIRLLDVHTSARYAEIAHQYFFDNWADLLEQNLELIPTEDWLSINVIGYDHAMARRFTELLGTPPPKWIAGRRFVPQRHRLGDEGMVNTLPRSIVQGFTACHLYFGPQAQRLTADKLDGFRKQYAEIGELYLS